MVPIGFLLLSLLLQIWLMFYILWIYLIELVSSLESSFLCMIGYDFDVGDLDGVDFFNNVINF